MVTLSVGEFCHGNGLSYAIYFGDTSHCMSKRHLYHCTYPNKLLFLINCCDRLDESLLFV